MPKGFGLTPEERRLRASLAAHTRWSKTVDRAAGTAAARAGFVRKLEDQVDPDRVLSDTERARRVENARQAHFARMRLTASKNRRKAKAS